MKGLKQVLKLTATGLRAMPALRGGRNLMVGHAPDSGKAACQSEPVQPAFVFRPLLHRFQYCPGPIPSSLIWHEP